MMQSKQLLERAVGFRGSRWNYSRCLRFPFVWMVLLAIGISNWSTPAVGQTGRLPKADYYINFANNADYFAADYQDAYKRFSRGYNSAYKFGTRRFLDSVCYLTMMGECNYHMGDYAEAVNNYEQALRLYLSYQAEGWQSRLQVPQVIPANNNAFVQAKINWCPPAWRV